MARVCLMDAERVEPDGWRKVTVPAWTEVTLGGGWVATVTPAGLACDCGKGVLCSLNPQARMALIR